MPPATKPCPFCGEEIKSVAKKCRYCKSYLDPADEPDDEFVESDELLHLLPVGRPPSAIAAGYLGLFAFFPCLGAVTGPLAVVFGIRALKVIGKDPELAGKGRAWFGIISGGICGALNLFLVVVLLISGFFAGRFK